MPRDRVLIPTCVGGHIAMTHVESVLAVALTLRGADVEFLLCDGALPACVACEVGYLPDDDPTPVSCDQQTLLPVVLRIRHGVRMHRWGCEFTGSANS